MTRAHMTWALPAGMVALGAGAITVWLAGSEVRDIQMRVPEEASLSLLAPRPMPAQRNRGTLIPGPGKPSERKGSWPGFRGSDGTNIVRDAQNLARSWPPEGPRVLWEQDLGEGHAGPAVHNGRVYLVDYDHEKKEDAIRCLSLDDGAEIWRYTYYVKVKRNHGMSRTVAGVNDDFVVALGPKCHVHCLDANTGRLVWRMDLVKQFGTRVPPWYAGQCPLLDGDAVILAPGGDPLMMAVELGTGRIRWRTPNPGGWGMTHSSIVAMDYGGSRQYIYCATKGVVGVSAKDGRLLWTKPDWRIALANVPTPVVVGNDRIFLSGGYNSGCAMIRLKGTGDRIETEELFRLKHTVFGSDQQTPILYEDHVYGVAPGGRLACLDLEGNRLWRSSAAQRFGLGPYLLADGLLFVLDDKKGMLHLVQAEPTGYKELASVRVLKGHDAWAPMAMAGARLLVRDSTHLVCVEVPGAL